MTRSRPARAKPSKTASVAASRSASSRGPTGGPPTPYSGGASRNATSQGHPSETIAGTRPVSERQAASGYCYCRLCVTKRAAQAQKEAQTKR